MPDLHLILPTRSAGEDFAAWVERARALPGFVGAKERKGAWDVLVEQRSEAARAVLERMTELAKGSP